VEHLDGDLTAEIGLLGDIDASDTSLPEKLGQSVFLGDQTAQQWIRAVGR
jgi:hypothetical protein